MSTETICVKCKNFKEYPWWIAWICNWPHPSSSCTVIDPDNIDHITGKPSYVNCFANHGNCKYYKPK